MNKGKERLMVSIWFNKMGSALHCRYETELLLTCRVKFSLPQHTRVIQTKCRNGIVYVCYLGLFIGDRQAETTMTSQHEWQNDSQSKKSFHHDCSTPRRISKWLIWKRFHILFPFFLWSILYSPLLTNTNDRFYCNEDIWQRGHKKTWLKEVTQTKFIGRIDSPMSYHWVNKIVFKIEQNSSPKWCFDWSKT